MSACDCAPLYPTRAKRVTGMAPPFVLRCSVSPCQAVASAISVYVVGSRGGRS